MFLVLAYFFPSSGGVARAARDGEGLCLSLLLKYYSFSEYMNKQFLKETFGWGFILWLIGYLLGMILFFIVPPAFIGWVITPIGILITLWVLFKKIKGTGLKFYLELAAIWTLLAIILDYIFIVKMLKPVGGYYKPDVYLYYVSIFVLPLIVFWFKNKKGIQK
jgi:hypothetical protein